MSDVLCAVGWTSAFFLALWLLAERQDKKDLLDRKSLGPDYHYFKGERPPEKSPIEKDLEAVALGKKVDPELEARIAEQKEAMRKAGRQDLIRP